MNLKQYTKEIIKKSIPRNLITYDLRSDDRRKLLFTFDDGPHDLYTNEILDHLDAINAKAVFFIVGSRVAGKESIVREIHRRGHLVGNHSFDHPDPGGKSYIEIYDDLRRCSDLIADILGCEPYFYRPPFGSITPSLLLAAKKAKLRIVHWSNEAGEWGKYKDHTSDEIVDILCDTIKADQILLFHDDCERIPYIIKHKKFMDTISNYCLNDYAIQAL